MKKSYSLTTDALYMMALKAHLAAEKKAKVKVKKKRKGRA